MSPRAKPVQISQKNDSQSEPEEEAESNEMDSRQAKHPEETQSKDIQVKEESVLKNKLSDIFKITRLANAEDEKQKDVVLATLQRNEFRTLTLEQIRQKVKSIDEPTIFCFKDLSPAHDSLLLDDYLQQSFDGEVDFSSRHKPPKTPEKGETDKQAEQETATHKCFLYLTPKPTLKAPITAKNLTLDRFVVKVFEWSAGESGVASRGNLQSSKLDAPDASLMTLAGLRKRLTTCTKMSVASKTHQFCTQSGETVVDEAMTFSDYLQLEETLSDTNADLPAVHVFYKLAHPKNEPHQIDIDSLPGKLTDTDFKLQGNEFDNGKSAKSFETQARDFEMSSFGKAGLGAAGNVHALDASYLTDTQWAEEAAFQLRAKISEDETHDIPDFVAMAPKAESKALPQVTEADMEKIRAQVGDWSNRPAIKGMMPDHWTKPAATSPQELAKIAELLTAKDCVSLPAKEDDASADAGKEGNKAVSTQATSTDTKTQQVTPAPNVEPQEVKAEVPTLEQVAENAALERYLPRTPAGRAVYTVLPSFQVNDDSRIEITVSSHEFETSMATNDFSKHSTEGSLSAGYGGFAATVSAGYSKESSKGVSQTENKYKKTMIAKYLLPRADVLLHPTDLEPTPELKAALERIRKNKNIADLRKLNQDFGQLWCQRITVGGRLQSTSIMEDEKKVTEQEQKEAFKMSVGLQVTTPVGVGAGVKHSNENGKQEIQNNAEVKKKESNVFEAVGGDTILAANPEAWSSTVADYRTWRVIDRDSLSSLADAISAIPGYAQVRGWFMQAVPTLSKYIELPPSREINLRFKLTAPTNQLSLSYLKKTEHYDASGDPIYYLGHSTGADVTPVKNELNFSKNVWAQCDITDAQPLFSPKSYRAPVLLGYSSNLVGDVAYGSQYSQDYTNSLWNVSAPFNDAISHGALVCISTVPLPKSDVTAGASATTATDPPLSLVVFRNQQSVFLPGLSDTSERHYWRILKHGAKSNGEHIKEGDEIFFAWAFQDQTAGFRDFTQDVFGRRRLQFPDDLKGRVLYMKLPWPRFEPLARPVNGVAVPNTMLLTDDPPAVNNNPQMASIRTVPSMTAAAEALSQGRAATDMDTFGLQDVRFRIDVVGNDGRGDVGDHLLKDLEQGAKKPEVPDPRVAEFEYALEMQRRYYEQLMFLSSMHDARRFWAAPLVVKEIAKQAGGG
ncbi:hypothetical protein G7054_g10735 [Neopestalotiopsis clavispora]|nr:hypothetical protein G7054_g10735 [Neopestalotiopsis clavispora]